MIQITDKDFEVPAALPMKPQRRVSTQSERWASDQRLAFEFLKRQEELATWIETVLETKLSSHDLHESLRSGLVLCQLVSLRILVDSVVLNPRVDESNSSSGWRQSTPSSYRVLGHDGALARTRKYLIVSASVSTIGCE